MLRRLGLPHRNISKDICVGGYSNHTSSDHSNDFLEDLFVNVLQKLVLFKSLVNFLLKQLSGFVSQSLRGHNLAILQRRLLKHLI